VKNDEVTRVLAAEGVSNFGAMLSRLAIPWLAALSLHATPLEMAALLVTDVVAATMASLLLGSWVDLTGKRYLMLLSDGVRGALLLMLALATWLGFITLPLLAVSAAISGAMTMVFELARSAWMAQRALPQELTMRNSQLSVITSVSEAASFAIGGWLYQWLGAVLSLIVDGLSYAASGLLLRGVAEVNAVAGAEPAHSPFREFLGRATSGFSAIIGSPVLRTLALIEALMMAGVALSGTSYMIFVSRDIGLPTGELGMIFALGGLGSVFGGMGAPRLGRKYGQVRAISFGLALSAIGAAFVPLAAGVGWVPIIWLALHQIVGDAGQTLYSVHDRTLRQTSVSSNLLARTDAGIRSIGLVATPVGAVIGGAIGTAYGTRVVLWIAVFAFAAATLVAWRYLAHQERHAKLRGKSGS
jgi:MFS family permease